MRGKTHLSIGVLTGIQTALLLQLPISLETVVCCALCSLLPDLDEENSTIANYIVNPKVNTAVRKLVIGFLTLLSTAVLAYLSYKEPNSTLKDILIISGVGGLSTFLLLSKYIKKKRVKKILLSLVGITVIIVTYLYHFLWIFYGVGIGIMIIPWLKHRGWTHTVWALALIYFFLTEWDRAYGSQLSIIGTAAYASHLLLGDNFTNSGVKLFYPHSFTFRIPLFSTGSKLGNTIEVFIVTLFLLIVLKQIL